VPTHDETAQFLRDFKSLTPGEKTAFKKALKKFIEDVPSRVFRKSLRARGVQGATNIFEMTWEGEDGRATFEYGDEVRRGEPHIIWRRIGTHKIFEGT